MKIVRYIALLVCAALISFAFTRGSSSPVLLRSATPRQRLPSVAVCFVGELRSSSRTAPAARAHLLDEWDADAFVVALVNMNITTQAADVIALRAAFGRRLVASRFGDADELLDPHLLATLPFAPAMEGSFEIASGRSERRRAFAEQLLNRKACHELVKRHEIDRAAPYSTYSRVRLDAMFFAPPPISYATHAAAEPRLVIVPTGDRWGQHGDGYSDRMIVGGSTAFEADATVWRSLLDNPSGRFSSVQNQWIMETVACRASISTVHSLAQRAVAQCALSKGRCTMRSGPKGPARCTLAQRALPGALPKGPARCTLAQRALAQCTLHL